MKRHGSESFMFCEFLSLKTILLLMNERTKTTRHFIRQRPNIMGKNA